MTLRSRALASPSSIDTCLSNQPQDPKDDINEQKITCFDINEQKIQQVLSYFVHKKKSLEEHQYLIAGVWFTISQSQILKIYKFESSLDRKLMSCECQHLTYIFHDLKC